MATTAKYPKILALGSPGIQSIFDEDVEITEKLDGSQFAWGNIDGEIIVRSKNQVMTIDNVQKIFQPAYDYVTSIKDKLPEGLFFYGETLHAPRHSTLAYERVPKHNIALFGVYHPSSMDHQAGTMGDYDEIKKWADELDIDAVPLLYKGKADPEKILSFFDKENPIVSYLGGQSIEGIVVKNYKQWLFMGQILTPVMAGKYVSEDFKEVHQKDWSKLNTGKGKIEAVKEKYISEARREKAIMRLKEEGQFTNSLKDIGEIIKIVKQDFLEECTEDVKQDLWSVYRDDFVRAVTGGIPNWYKERLLMNENKETEDA